MTKRNFLKSMASTVEKRGKTKSMIIPMQVPCCFFIYPKWGWLGPPLKLPPTSSKAAKSPNVNDRQVLMAGAYQVPTLVPF
jgi:hypothetical protein